MIIDFHTHVFPEKIAQKTIEHLSAVSNQTPHTDGTISGLLRSMEEHNIDYSVVLPIATKPPQAATINSYAAQITKTEGIISFGSVHPFSDNWRKELDGIAQMGLKGIKLHPEYQGFFIDDEKVFPVIEYARGLDLIIVFHSGVDTGFQGELRCPPERVRNMLGKIGGGKLVFAHGGGYECWDGVLKHMAGQDIYFDLSFTFGRLSDDKLLRLIRSHGAEKCLFGSDSPWNSQGYDVKAMESIGLSDEERQQILYKNAAKLLGLGD